MPLEAPWQVHLEVELVVDTGRRHISEALALRIFGLDAPLGAI